DTANADQARDPCDTSYRSTNGSPATPVAGTRRRTRSRINGHPERIPESSTPESIAANTHTSRLPGRLAATNPTASTCSR
ncbi:MAG: hypothetical protein ACK559_19250, partial [bacterium]